MGTEENDPALGPTAIFSCQIWLDSTCNIHSQFRQKGNEKKWKAPDTEAGRSRLKSWPCHVLSVQLLGSCLASLSYSFLICTMGIASLVLMDNCCWVHPAFALAAFSKCTLTSPGKVASWCQPRWPANLWESNFTSLVCNPEYTDSRMESDWISSTHLKSKFYK